jgi:hypothetical protein
MRCRTAASLVALSSSQQSPQSPCTWRDTNAKALKLVCSSSSIAPGVATSWPSAKRGALLIKVMRRAVAEREELADMEVLLG